MENLYLKKPARELKEPYLDYIREWRESGEPFIPHSTTKDPSDYERMIAEFENEEKGIGLKEGWVSSTTFLLMGEENRILGAAHIRHQLTDDLTNRGGHIGYGIRPSERLKGYATKILELALMEAKKLGIEEVLVVCDADNIASEKTILNNHGIQTEDFVEEDGNVIKRFWITV